MITVRTGRGYEVDFNVALGQKDVRFVRRTDTPLGVFGNTADAICVLEPGADLTHCVNAVPLFPPRRPFLVTFEDHLPRMWPTGSISRRIENLLIDRLGSDHCHRILAMSEYAVRQMRHTHRDHPGRPAIETKLEVLHPSVVPRADQPRSLGETLRVIAVGADFMRKGMPAVLGAHELLRSRGLPIETTIVSSLKWSPDDYIGPTDEALVHEATGRLELDGVTHIGGLPNAETLALMDSHDFLILPTLHDTFGYVVIEAMAGGVPVIATETCAIPEVVESSRSGWLLPLDRDPDIGRWPWVDRRRDPDYDEAYRNAVGDLTTAIADRLEAVWSERDGYEEMSAAAIERVKTGHDRAEARRRLETLYAEAL